MQVESPIIKNRVSFADPLVTVPDTEEYSLALKYFDKALQRVGPFDAEGFALPGNNLMVPYYSPTLEGGVFALDTWFGRWYMNSLFSKLDAVVQRVKSDRATATLVVPYHPEAAWFKQMVPLLADTPIVIPPAHGVFLKHGREPMSPPPFVTLICHLSPRCEKFTLAERFWATVDAHRPVTSALVGALTTRPDDLESCMVQDRLAPAVAGVVEKPVRCGRGPTLGGFALKPIEHVVGSCTFMATTVMSGELVLEESVSRAEREYEAHQARTVAVMTRAQRLRASAAEADVAASEEPLVEEPALLLSRAREQLAAPEAWLASLWATHREGVSRRCTVWIVWY
ncbi:hypothetical protein SARC_04494 [Sphaeroforma arctica JP610]|uniref:Uncharacterized protein n=1 Tax=Sphaeroforma arctica JP610 TaxID=667725 RepID=A0A0L0G296_9EUKA|nr:hypothetical protein SARC_04494 [Sphaeroforma arctica JP610]KNC83257.1 hypothetical protein SARC_04494 [Sphaeroforma arctica JP610]|eukprot:XP_014157159.1 hypothetical protein SARC_04494 [Sphaeroforma arctica JP610]